MSTTIPYHCKLGLHALDSATSHWVNAVTMTGEFAAEDFHDDTVETLAKDVVAAVQSEMLTQAEQYYVDSLAQLFHAGEITFVGLLIRLNNLYPEEMSALGEQLRARIQHMLRNPQ